MSNSKPLYSLSVDEYIDLNRKLFSEEAEKLIHNRLQGYVPTKVVDDIIFIDEVVELTGYKKSTIYSKVCRFEIPILTRLRPLTFSRKALITWINEGKPGVMEHQANNYTKRK